MGNSAWSGLAQGFALGCVVVASCIPACGASEGPWPGGPTDAKAQKTFAQAVAWQNKGDRAIALDTYRKANQQDGGHCALCLSRAFTIAQEISDYRTQENILRDELSLEQSDPRKATVHFDLGVALQREGMAEKGPKKDACFNDSCGEFKAALWLDPKFTTVHYGLGVSLAYLHQDDAARTEFAAFLDNDHANPGLHQRAARYVDRVELARARMAPPFSLTTLDGQHITMDDLAGKVVLIDFWATWCGPCREALPHIREIARRFTGQPFVVLSVSLDGNDEKWKAFVAGNGMTWLQYRDGGFTGPMATKFLVRAIPATFSIDADGVLEDQHVGDENIEGKLKKMVAQTAERANQKPVRAESQAGGNVN
jgi:thiol-disulfide isomerase/thioredoxin